MYSSGGGVHHYMNPALLWRHLALAAGAVALVVGLVARRWRWSRASIAIGLVLLVGTFVVDAALRHELVEGFRAGSRPQ
jgi:hypothetical protein